MSNLNGINYNGGGRSRVFSVANWRIQVQAITINDFEIAFKVNIHMKEEFNIIMFDASVRRVLCEVDFKCKVK